MTPRSIAALEIQNQASARKSERTKMAVAFLGKNQDRRDEKFDRYMEEINKSNNTVLDLVDEGNEDDDEIIEACRAVRELEEEDLDKKPAAIEPPPNDEVVDLDADDDFDDDLEEENLDKKPAAIESPNADDDFDAANPPAIAPPAAAVAWHSPSPPPNANPPAAKLPSPASPMKENSPPTSVARSSTRKSGRGKSGTGKKRRAAPTPRKLGSKLEETPSKYNLRSRP